MRLNGSLQVQDYFTPYNQQCLSNGDVDLGSQTGSVTLAQPVSAGMGNVRLNWWTGDRR